jgi:hypothetical protein
MGRMDERGRMRITVLSRVIPAITCGGLMAVMVAMVGLAVMGAMVGT